MDTSPSKKLVSIREAAELLGVSLDTLRRWDKKGRFPALRMPGGRRFYALTQIELLQRDLFVAARDWASRKEGVEPLESFYCQNSITFQVWLMRMEHDLLDKKDIRSWAPLIVSAAGEIGNNSFDHNLGNWRDIPGVFYGYDVQRRIITLADRGQGVLATLKRVKPELATDEEALETAFTEVISGRAPEARGNGLKLVKLIVERYPLFVDFYSGEGKCTLRHGKPMDIEASGISVSGCLAVIRY